MSIAAAWRRARLLRDTRKAMLPPEPGQFGALGRHAIVIPPTRVESPDCVFLADGVVVHEHAWLCVQRTDGREAPRLEIGERTSINRFAKIVVHERVTLGAGVIIGDRVYLSDVEHVPVPDGLPQLSAPRPVVVEDEAFLGIGVVVKPGVTLGRRCYIAANAVVSDDVPPYALVVGNPARVVRQGGPGDEPWQRVVGEA